jgi:hypothetical protein
MKYFISVLFISAFAFTIGACTHDSVIGYNGGGSGEDTTNIDPPPSPDPRDTIKLVECSKDTVFFSQTVYPLVTTLCGQSGCHLRSDYSSFYLIYDNGTASENELNSYNAIKSRFSSVSNLTNNINSMINQNVNGFVEPDATQLQNLKTWISQGRLFNSCTDCDTTKFTYAAIIEPILSTYCVSCHNNQSSMGGVNLATHADVVNEIVSNPGRLVASIEWTTGYTGNKAMPYGGSRLPDCYIKQIKNWIDAGTLDN